MHLVNKQRGERRGPLTKAEAAAIHYEQKYHWPCGARAESVWICLPSGVGSLLVDPPYAARLHCALLERGARGPVSQWPGKPPSCEFFVRGPAEADTATRKTLYPYGALYRGSSRLITLPPSQDPTGPHIWLAPPVGFAEFPQFELVLEELRAISR